MEQWGTGPEVFGLIHADLGTKANVLFHQGRAHAIDFDDSVFGYWVYDLAIPLSDWEGDAMWPAYKDALLDGYQELRFIPAEQLAQLELFQAAIRGLEIFWGTAATMRYPGSKYWIQRREEAWQHLHRYLTENPA
jgi:Ser/Thr protein kinase RdoA (MazF antagonist)